MIIIRGDSFGNSLDKAKILLCCNDLDAQRVNMGAKVCDPKDRREKGRRRK